MAKYQELDTTPKDPEVAEAVSFDSVGEAKEGIEEIEDMYNRAKSRDRRRYLKNSIHEAYRRSVMQLSRKNLRPKTREKYQELVKLFGKAIYSIDLDKKKIDIPSNTRGMSVYENKLSDESKRKLRKKTGSNGSLNSHSHRRR